MGCHCLLWRILEWVVFPFSRGSSRLRDWTRVSCLAGRFFTIWATREALLLIITQLTWLSSFCFQTLAWVPASPIHWFRIAYKDSMCCIYLIQSKDCIVFFFLKNELIQINTSNDNMNSAFYIIIFIFACPKVNSQFLHSFTFLQCLCLRTFIIIDFPAGSVVKNLPASAGGERDMGSIPALGRCFQHEMAIHSSIVAWRIRWMTEEPGRLLSTGSQRVRHDRVTEHTQTIHIIIIINNY